MMDNYKNAIPWLIFAVFLLFYIFVPNYNLIYDSYSYSISIKKGVDFFHPHHLLYNFFGYLLFKLFSFTGWGSMKTLSLANSLLGASALVIIYKLINISAGRFNAIFGTILIGVVYSFRYFATSVEVNMMTFLCIMLALYFLLISSNRKYSNWLVYWFLSIAVLFHQIAVLAIPPVIIYDVYRHKSLKRTVVNALPGLAAGFIVYLTVAITQAQEKTIGGIYRWLTFYRHLDTWGKIGPESITNAAWGKLKTLVGGEIIREAFYTGHWPLATMAYLIIIGLIFTGLVWLFALACLNLRRNRDGSQWLLLAMAVLFGVFTFWWAPANDDFWFYPVTFFIIFVVRGAVSYLSRWLIILTTVLLASVNIVNEFIPSANNNNSIFYNGAQVFERLKLESNDLVITNYSQIRLAYEYYTGIHVPTACMMFLPSGPKAEVIQEYHQRISAALEKGRVFVFSDEIRPEPYRNYLFTRFSPADYKLAYAPYMNHLVLVDSLNAHGQTVEISRLNMDFAPPAN